MERERVREKDHGRRERERERKRWIQHSSETKTDRESVGL